MGTVAACNKGVNLSNRIPLIFMVSEEPLCDPSQRKLFSPNMARLAGKSLSGGKMVIRGPDLEMTRVTLRGIDLRTQGWSSLSQRKMPKKWIWRRAYPREKSSLSSPQIQNTRSKRGAWRFGTTQPPRINNGALMFMVPFSQAILEAPAHARSKLLPFSHLAGLIDPGWPYGNVEKLDEHSDHLWSHLLLLFKVTDRHHHGLLCNGGPIYASVRCRKEAKEN